MPYGLINADVMQTSTTNGVLGAKNASTLQNRLIDAGFTINQRGYVSGTSLSSGTYAHDRWKAGSGGCTYTFTQGSLGVPIVITITAGSLQQVIEGCNMPEGGTYVLSWTGTAQARFNGGTYGSSPLAVTGITAGANTTIEFNTGTCSYPQLEVGTSATGFEYRMYGQELALCQRYFCVLGAGNAFNISLGAWYSTSQVNICPSFPVTMRSTPSVYSTFGAGYYGIDFSGASSNISSWTVYRASQYSTMLFCTGLTGGSTGASGQVFTNNASSFLGLSAEL
jgi:hypothetical protein